MRLTEFIHYLTRDDIGMAQNPKDKDYTHFKPWTQHKRARYLYQCHLKGNTPVE